MVFVSTICVLVYSWIAIFPIHSTKIHVAHKEHFHAPCNAKIITTILTIFTLAFLKSEFFKLFGSNFRKQHYHHPLSSGSQPSSNISNTLFRLQLFRFDSFGFFSHSFPNRLQKPQGVIYGHCSPIRIFYHPLSTDSYLTHFHLVPSLPP